MGLEMSRGVPMTADLVAEAIALCEREIKEWREVIPLGVGDNENYAPTQLNSWLTHKAELEEHKILRWEGEDYCQRCESETSNITHYPCDFATTKAKRLSGVSE